MNKSDVKILIIEDESAIALLERKVLEKAGFAVEDVRDGTRGLAYLEDRQVTVVVLDYYLPDMTGAEVIAAMGERVAEVPVIVVTGSEDPEIARAVRRSGAAAYLVKDPDLDFLRQLPDIVESALQARDS